MRSQGLGGVLVDAHVGHRQKQESEGIKGQVKSKSGIADVVLHHVVDQDPGCLDQQVEQHRKTDIFEQALDDF